MNKMDKAIFVMMTIWSYMKQKSFSYLLVTHHGVMSCRHGFLWLMLLMVSRLCHIVVGDEPFLKTYCILRLCKSIPFTFQKVPFQPAKGHVSACRLPSFAKRLIFTLLIYLKMFVLSDCPYIIM